MREFDNMMDLADEMQHLVEQQVQGMRRVTASQLGLDMRCGSAYVDHSMDTIVVDTGCAHSFDYYGGFEYVNPEDRLALGSYTVYLNSSERVSDALESLMEQDGLCESEAEHA